MSAPQQSLSTSSNKPSQPEASVQSKLPNSNEMVKVVKETGDAINKEITQVAGQACLTKLEEIVEAFKADIGFSLPFGLAMTAIFVLILIVMFSISLPFVIALCICEFYFNKPRNKTSKTSELVPPTASTKSHKKNPRSKSDNPNKADKSKDHKSAHKKKKSPLEDDIPTEWKTTIPDGCDGLANKSKEAHIGGQLHPTKNASVAAGKHARHHSKVQQVPTGKQAQKELHK